jgi:hypothetical protein
LKELEARRDAGASPDEIADAFPPDLLHQIGYYGPADRAASEFRRVAEGLDVAVVRIVGSRPGMEAARAVMEACRPELVAVA